MHAYVRTCSTVKINSTRDRSVPTVRLLYFITPVANRRGTVCLQLIVGWFYIIYSRTTTTNVKGWREKKEELNRELRVVVVVIVYKEKWKEHCTK